MGWILVSEDQALQHPAYGIKGAASALKGLSLLIPILGFLSAFGSFTEIVRVRSLTTLDYVLLIPWVIFLIWSGINVVLLDKKKTSFRTSFFIFVAAGPFITITAQLAWVLGTSIPVNIEQLAINFLSSLFWWGVWAAIWVPYVLLSKRINVTLMHRIRSNDPSLSANDAGS